MKIVDVCAFYTPHGGGVKTYVERKLAIGPAMGHEIVLVVPSDANRVEDRGPGARIVHVKAPRLIFDHRYRYFDDATAVHDMLDAEAPDFVEASSPWRTASIVADWRGCAPRALIMHADPLSAYAYRWFGGVAHRDTIDRGFDLFWQHLRRLGKKFDLTVSANHDLTRRLTNGGMASVATLPMGIDPGIFSPRHRDPALRRNLLARCGLGENATLMLGIGRHGAEKRWPMVIDACVAASQRRPLGLVIIGDGRHRAQLQNHIGGNPHIHLLAPVQDRAMLARVLASGDALIHGCEAETFGMVAAEAAASGMPLVVPDTGGAASILAMGAGVAFASGDARSATDALDRLHGEGFAKFQAFARDNATRIPTIEQHFAALFDRYEALGLAFAMAA
jgi:alpha-1,6-mannosyltransferase